MSNKWIKWIKTAHTGLRYYEHEKRKHGKRRDRYYAIRFKVDGKEYSYGIGWWSDRIPDEVLKNDPGMGFEEYINRISKPDRGLDRRRTKERRQRKNARQTRRKKNRRQGRRKRFLGYGKITISRLQKTIKQNEPGKAKMAFLKSGSSLLSVTEP